MNSPALTYSSQPKMGTKNLAPLEDKNDLSLAYTPGIAEISQAIQKDDQVMFTHTFRRNNLAVISDGSAVLGLGNIGHKASFPVMEGKAMLFKRFADIDAIPLIINSQDTQIFIDTVLRIADSFAAINLEDIAAPRCFEIEETLKRQLSIPLMHDDQHGTSVVVLAALQNSLKLTNKDRNVRIVVVGSGAAGIAISKIILGAGFRDITLVDSKGIIHADRSDLNPIKQQLAFHTNPRRLSGSLTHALDQADVFIGVSKANLLKPAMIKSMRQDPIIIAMANPIPEIMPDQARRVGAAVVATGRSDFPNQVNNALAFPGMFRGAIDARSPITEASKLAASQAIATYHQHHLTHDNILPSILDPQVHRHVAQAVYASCK